MVMTQGQIGEKWLNGNNNIDMLGIGSAMLVNCNFLIVPFCTIFIYFPSVHPPKC